MSEPTRKVFDNNDLQIQKHQFMTDIQQFAIFEFVTFCIEQYKRTVKRDGRDVEQMFERLGVVDFLVEHYAVLHTQSDSVIIFEINQYINQHTS